MIHCIIIARSSTDRHDVSCKSQIKEIAEAAKGRGEKVVKTYEFSRKRHSDFLEDPDFKEILQAAKRKNRGWTKIWFYDTSRLSRNRMKAQTTKAFFKRQGIEIEFLKVPKTGEEPLDNVIEGILETFDQLLSDFSRAGSIRGQKQNIRSGYRAGGRAPYGYRLDQHLIGTDGDNNPVYKSRLLPHQDNFPIVQEYLKRRASGESRGSIIRDFKNRSIKSPSGKAYWSTSTCLSIEHNIPVYLGHLVYNRKNRQIDGKYIGGERYRPEDEWEIKHNMHDAAITEEEATRIKKLLRKKGPKKDTSPRRYLMTSILKCGVCHGPMVGDSGYYTCIHKRTHKTDCTNNKILSDFIDKQTIAFVKDILLSRTHFETVITETRKAYRKELESAIVTSAFRKTVYPK